MTLTILTAHSGFQEAVINIYRTRFLRLALIAIGFPAALMALGVEASLWVHGSILAAEFLVWIASRPYAQMSEAPETASPDRSDYSGHHTDDDTDTDLKGEAMPSSPLPTKAQSAFSVVFFLLSCAWLSISVVCWLSGKPGLQITAAFQWCAYLLYAMSTLQSSLLLLLVCSTPGLLVAALLPFTTTIGSPATDIYLKVTSGLCLSFIALLGIIAYKQRQRLREVTREVEEQRAMAEYSNRSKSAFLATMSHEIRTPLNGVLGMAQCLQTSRLTASQDEQVSTIIDCGETLMALLDDVLDISKIEAGTLAIVPTKTDLQHKLSRIYQLFQPHAQEKGLHFSFDIAKSVPQYVSCDPVRIRQCVSNIVTNAIKFTDTGEVVIRVYSQGEESGIAQITIEVRDTGVGISEATLSRIFSQMKKTPGKTTPLFQGTGLGLAISHRLAQLMDGQITAESELGQGSTFRFTFPAPVVQISAPKTRQALSEPEAAAPITNLQGRRVLLVDDNPVNRKVACLFLAQLNADVTEAEDGLSALHCLKTKKFDFVLLDMHMPVMDGEETVKSIRSSGEEWSRIPVIALTADVMRGDRVRYLAMGMDGLIKKPIEDTEFYAEIGRALNKATGFQAYCAAEFDMPEPECDPAQPSEKDNAPEFTQIPPKAANRY